MLEYTTCLHHGQIWSGGVVPWPCSEAPDSCTRFIMSDRHYVPIRDGEILVKYSPVAKEHGIYVRKQSLVTFTYRDWARLLFYMTRAKLRDYWNRR